jgi:hypothetical protein
MRGTVAIVGEQPSSVALWNDLSSVGIATDWTAWFDFQQGQKIFFTPQCSDRFWGPLSLLSTEYREINPGGKGQGVKLTTNLYLVPRKKMVEIQRHSPIRLPGVVLNTLKSGGYYMYHLLYYAKSLNILTTECICVSYGSHNKQRLFS